MNKGWMLTRELEVLLKLDHPNIIKFYEIYYYDTFIYFVMEYCSGGDLWNYIVENGYFCEMEAAVISRKIISAINHMHSKQIVHRDIKPENMLFANTGKDSEIKLIDFGLSRVFTPDKFKFQLPTTVGTPLYVAPEVIVEKGYDFKCDCWSLGVLIYTLLCGHEPFIGQGIAQVYKKIQLAEFDYSD